MHHRAPPPSSNNPISHRPIGPSADRVDIRAKKTGLVDQGVTEKPGEFSNLVHEWDNGVHRPCFVLEPRPKLLKFKERFPQTDTRDLRTVNHHAGILSKGGDQVLTAVHIEISKCIEHIRRAK
jgi:hypothetical protein